MLHKVPHVGDIGKHDLKRVGCLLLDVLGFHDLDPHVDHASSNEPLSRVREGGGLPGHRSPKVSPSHRVVDSSS